MKDKGKVSISLGLQELKYMVRLIENRNAGQDQDEHWLDKDKTSLGILFHHDKSGNPTYVIQDIYYEFKSNHSERVQLTQEEIEDEL